MAHYKDIIVQSNGKVKCVLCKIIINDSETLIENHIEGNDHQQLFIQRLMITNALSITNSNIVCHLCNDVLDENNMLQHIHDQQHIQNKENLKVCVENDGGYIQLPENITSHSTVHCIVCDRSVHFRTHDIIHHIQSVHHQRARSIAVQPLNAIFSIEGNDDELWCKVCQVYFENYMELIFEHVDKNTKHGKKLGKILKVVEGQNICIEQYLFDPKEDKAMCFTCGIGVPCNVYNLQGHIEGSNHKNKMST